MKRWIIRISLAFVVGLLVLAGSCNPFDPLAAAGFGDLKIYWVTGLSLRSVNLDGTGYQTLYTDPGAAGYASIEVDIYNGHIYVADTAFGRVLKFDLDGNLLDSNFLTGSVTDIALDPIDEWLYYYTGSELYRTSLDKSSTDFFGGLTISHMEIDAINRRLYVCDGATPTNFFYYPIGPILGVSTPVGQSYMAAPVSEFVLDVKNNWIYWLQTSQVRRDTLPVMTLSQSEEILTDPSVTEIRGLAVDPYENKVYYTLNFAPSAVRSKFIDPTFDIEYVLTDIGPFATDMWIDLWP